jgi:hypothetical protein
MHVFVYLLCDFCPKHFSFKEEQRGMIKMCIGLHIMCPLLFSDISESLIFSTDFRKISNFVKILPVEEELLRADRPTHDVADSRFSQFCERA